MKSLFKRYIWLQIIYGVLLAAVGITTIILAFVNGEIIDRTLSIIIAVALFLFAVIMIVSSMLSETKEMFSLSLIYASLFIALGVVLLVNPSLISTIIVIMLAVFIIAYGAVCLVKGIVSIFYRMAWYWIALLFLLGAIGITGGILALCYPGIAFTVTFVVLGIGLAALGIYEIVLAIIAMKKVDKIEKVVEEKPQE